MKTKSCLTIILTAVIILITSAANATWITDNEFKFKIDVPSDWSNNNYLEGTDKIYDFTDPSGNIAIQIRCFEVDASVNASLIAKVFDEGLVADGATKLSYSNEELNGLPGILSGYSNTYDGMAMGIVTFSAVSGGVGYLIFTVMPMDRFEQLMPAANAVLNSFTVLSSNSQQQLAQQQQQQQTKPSGGLGGLTGSTSQSSSAGLTGGSVGSGNNYVKISGSDINGTFTFSKSDSYPLSSVNTVFVKGLDDQNNTILEIVFYRIKGTGTFIYENHNNNGEPGFVINNVNGQRVPGSIYNGSGKLVITEYQEGGRIKGHVNSELNGHVIKANFDLPLGKPK